MGVARLEFEYDLDFLLFGVSCHQRDFRFCYALNKKLDIRLQRGEDVDVGDGQEEDVSGYAYFEYYDELNHIKYMLVGNRGQNGLLIAEHRQADFFVLIDGFVEVLDRSEIVQKIRDIDSVLAVFELDPNQLRSKHNLLFE